MNSKLLEHLRNRPIAPIVNESSETFSTHALKVMCIIDYKLERSGLYPKLIALPKLMWQLLNIRSFDQFRYIKYNLPKESKIDGKVLKCKDCEIIAPYLVVLEHMAISHNIHSSPKLCIWCEKVELQAHNASNTLDQCYENYLQKHQLSSTNFHTEIVTFYNVLNEMAKKIRLTTRRSKIFKNAMNSGTNETIPIDQTDGSISNRIVVYKPRKRFRKGTDFGPMEKLFGEAMKYFHKQRADEYINKTRNLNETSTIRSTSDSITSTPNQSSNATNSITSTQMNTNDPDSTMLHPSNRYELSPQFDMPSSSSQLYSPPSLNFPEIQPLPHFGMSSDESPFAGFIRSVWNNIKDEQLKNRAKLEIQQVIFRYSAEDVAKQINGQ